MSEPLLYYSPLKIVYQGSKRSKEWTSSSLMAFVNEQ